MKSHATTSLERDRALVQAMRLLGEPDEAIEEFLACLEMPEAQRDELRQVARPADMTAGDVIEMNPLTSQPQRAKPR
jgi:ribosomal 50S subunit-associated protein YjgA (DUF615 family)